MNKQKCPFHVKGGICGWYPNKIGGCPDKPCEMEMGIDIRKDTTECQTNKKKD